MRDHQAVREKLLDLSYGELSRREAQAVERHLAGCEACRAELARIRETRAAMSALALEPAPEGGERVLLAAARQAAERVQERRRGRLLPPWVWVGSVGAVAIAAVVAVTVRLLPMGPGRIEDPEALLGRAPASPAAPAESLAGQAPEPPSPAPGPAEEAAVERRAEPAPGRAESRRPPARQATARPERVERVERVEAARDVSGEKLARLRAGPGPSAPEEAPDAAAAAPPPSPAGAAAPERHAPSKGAAAPSRAPSEPAGAAEAEPPAPAGFAAGAGVAPDPVDSWERLRAAGRLQRSVRRFEGCPEEQVREIDRDPRGGVIRLATLRASAGWVEQFYAPDGTLAAVRFGPPEARRTIRLGPGPPPLDLPPGLVLRAAGVSEEAVPRCR
jgi:hypothetical protein